MIDNGGMDTPLGPGDHLLTCPGQGGMALRLHLTPERAVHWPAGRTLFVADMHLGKAAVFRARGLPVPRGTTTATLQRLSQVIERCGAQRLVVLGDFLHARESHALPTLAVLRAWRHRHALLQCVVVQGNHDRHAGSVEASLGFVPQHRPFQALGLIGVHEAHEARPWLNADEPHPSPLILTGHVHPVAVIRGRLDRLRLPCYWLQGLQGLQGHQPSPAHATLTLPAFGEFTGGHEVDPQFGQVFIVGERVLRLPVSPPRP